MRPLVTKEFQTSQWRNFTIFLREVSICEPIRACLALKLLFRLHESFTVAQLRLSVAENAAHTPSKCGPSRRSHVEVMRSCPSVHG